MNQESAGRENEIQRSGYSITVVSSRGYLYFRPPKPESRPRPRKLLASSPQYTPEYLDGTGQTDLEGE
jgi:hypothetical protein